MIFIRIATSSHREHCAAIKMANAKNSSEMLALLSKMMQNYECR